MTDSGGHRGSERARPAQWPVLSGQIPPLADSCITRQETGLSLASLPAGQTTVLAAANDAATWSMRTQGGTGKTHLAATLAHECLDRDLARLVVWVTATSQDAVICSYARALRDVGRQPPAEGQERAAVQFLDLLASTDQPWLVVLDDLSDAAALEGFWPRGAAGWVLVTTQHQDVGGPTDSRALTVGNFSPREALWYLTERLRGDRDQRVGAPDLANELGLLPIALGQATAVMAETGLDCRQYGALVGERKSQLAAGPSGMHASIRGATWSLSAEFADQLPPAGLAKRALRLISMLSSHGIPGAVLTSNAACAYLAGSRESFPADVTQVRSAVYNLVRAGLVTVDDTSPARTVLAHELVQAIARESLSTAERDEAAVAAADALAQAWSSRGISPDFEQSLRDCTARLHEMAGTALWMPECHPVLVRAGESLASTGCSGAALAYWRKMLGVSHQHLGPAHPLSARFREYLGIASVASGNTGEAVVMCRDALTELENTRTACDPAILAARANLARAYRAADRPGDAVALAEHTVAECEQVLGAGHPQTLAAVGTLADSYLAAGRFKEAIGLCKNALAGRERFQGPDDLDTIAARVRLASAYRAANKPKDALKHYERALADRERLQGPDDLDAITARRELALTYHMAGKLAYSVAQYERALAACHQVLGPGHRLTGEINDDLDTVASYGVAKLGIDLRAPKRRDGSRRPN
ncbi:MAG TPA: tetratricopeptide repeat protein [Streptosporangiaceae bacterium]|nr:tetratricopeptide repeat protein [Streptosporangiaceae bacterium]